jgi:hypothetical protein
MLSPQHYVYYTWMDPLKPQELIISSNQQTTTIQLYVSLRIHHRNTYTVIIYDGRSLQIIVTNNQNPNNHLTGYGYYISASTFLQLLSCTAKQILLIDREQNLRSLLI